MILGINGFGCSIVERRFVFFVGWDVVFIVFAQITSSVFGIDLPIRFYFVLDKKQLSFSKGNAIGLIVCKSDKTKTLHLQK
jgi:hypothetical protein